VICPKGQLLTLTSQDAERRVGPAKRPLLSEGTVKDLDGLLERVGKAGCRRIELTVSAAEELAHLIESVSILLLAGGLLALYIEFKTPGFGLPGVLGILLLAIWFWGHNIAGLAGMEEMILFGLGVVLLLLEIFLIPGFGIVGIAGITLIIVSLLMAMLTRYPGEPWVPSFPRLEIPLRNLGLALILSVLGAWIVGRFLPKTTAFGKLVLSASTNRQEGYAASEDASRLVGLRGVAETPLRPAGMAMFGDERLDVVARGDYIEAGAQIVIAETHGNRIIVEKA
jgi:membrane-bound serine protease (ClpP class)